MIPHSSEMLILNLQELHDEPLCSFLKKLDDKEKNNC